MVLPVPEAPGVWQVRYHAGQSNAVLAAGALRVEPATATVEGPTDGAGGVNASRSGLVRPGQRRATTSPSFRSVPLIVNYLDYGYTRDGSTVELEAPLDLGRHELRYVTGTGAKHPGSAGHRGHAWESCRAR